MSSRIKTNYHTHSTICDGHNTAEEMVLAAIEKKFDILGFSGHSMYPFASTWHISPKEHELYTDTVRQLAEKYKDKIKILLGFEADFISSMCNPSFERFKKFNPDYLIGSVHYIVNEKGYVTVDESVEGVKGGIERLFNGNGKKFVQEYFSLEREMIRNCDFTILGHPDLVRVRNGKLNFFDENDSWYKNELKELVKEIKKKDVIVEINTGALGRKLMDDVYPSEYLLGLLCEARIRITINSDAHTTDALDSAFDIAQQKAVKAGFKELVIIDGPVSKRDCIKMQPLL
ncbi:MAG: histidinol-phosphatase [Treponema sp.]|uniref:histidinol-phosphatase n=1 Tax=Treponema sp. TaxID=166 RepID=UPI001B53956A|nr:histidinol-phosphatase [Treponema sp.]MBP5401811.1 histidinol-phosphatase [Treponema sp.]MBR5934119.1 histidinol-phosphatase [Treponema sp.]